MKWFRLVLFLGLASTVFVALNRPIGVVPPLGKFLNPFSGFWTNGRAVDEIPEEIVLEGLREDVKVLWDDRRVPHIFAKSTHDLYLVQGYLTARDRLWQLDFQPIAAAGRISEILGERTLEYDRFQRRLGMTYAAEKALNLMFDDPETREAVEGYTSGVNAWISELDEKDLPVEYKSLNYRPEPFTPLKGALLLKFFAQMLTFSTEDYAMTRSVKELGGDTCSRLYLEQPYFIDPIIPIGTPWEFGPLAPVAPDGSTETGGERMAPGTDNSEGSNNWAVSGGRTESGYPLLCFDPHLELNLPCIWHEVQLVAPGVNVHGFTAPGAPGVVFGFNSHVAWGGTNAEADVTDWYDIKFKDGTRNEYWHGGEWLPTEKRVEEIQVRGGQTVRDTVVFTHHGPVPYAENEEPFYSGIPPGRALGWVGHEPSNPIGAILGMNKAGNYEEFRDAIYMFDNLLLNLAYADVHGDIAIWHMGKFPLRWKGQGSEILDGGEPLNDWQGWIPKARLPHVKNPPRGFVSSSNQTPADSTYPYYLPGHYVSTERAGRVNERLAELDNARPEDMMDLQMDITNVLARQCLPVMLALVDLDSLSADEIKSYQELDSWDYEHRGDVIATRVFTYWWWWLYMETWEDDIKREDYSLTWPSRDVMKKMLLEDFAREFFDDTETEALETLPDVALASFRKAHEDLTDEFGPFGPQWAVAKSRGTDISHMGEVPGLGVENLETGGTAYTVNATSLTHGPTFRMTVSLEPDVKGWGHNAGGQSGNPGSADYDAFVDDWLNGNMREFLYLKSPEETHERIIGRTILRGVK